MTQFRFVCCAAWLLCVAFSSMALAEGYGTRQYYGAWHKHTSGYAYRPYYYKPSPQHVGFKHHYVIRQPKDNKHLYFYNPYKKQYWGRCPIESAKPSYSLLKEADRRANLAEIPESAFPPPGDLPPIPGAEDGAILDLPPDDLPDFSALPSG